jgi:transcriptional regulator with XRE-family HTH domain
VIPFETIGYMRKRTSSGVTFGSSIKGQRFALGLTQRELASELGVKASYISYLEKDQRRPSITVLNRLGEVLGLERSELLMLAYPETREMVDGGRVHGNQKRHTAWREFSENRTLLRKYRLTREELSTLKRINTLGKVGSPRDFLFVLMAIRQALSKESR